MSKVKRVVDYLLKKKEPTQSEINHRVSTFLYGDETKQLVSENETNFYDCFKDRRKVAVNESEILERIIRAYQLSKKEQAAASSLFQVSNEWLPIYKQYMGEIMEVLSTGSKNDLSRIYANFMREDCSVGLHGLPVNMRTTYFENKNVSGFDKDVYLNDSYFRYKIWKETIGKRKKVEDLIMPEFGNAYGYFVEGVFIRSGADYLNYYSEIIKNLIGDSNSEGKKRVLEIGAGYGGLAYFLSRNSELSYIDIDLPENMALTAYFLMSSFPDKKFMLYGEDSLSVDSLDKYDFVILPNFAVDQIPDDYVDLAFNSYSLAEMSTETIRYYVKNLKRISSRFIYHVNHTTVVNEIGADDFGIEEDGTYNFLFKVQARWNLMRNFKMDEFEYLYEKRRAK